MPKGIDIYTPNPRTSKGINPEELEKLASEGKTRSEIAKAFSISYHVLSKRLNSSAILNFAFKSGRRKAKQTEVV
jgi:DNA invertase Pin-like site-specific DNA recombinase